MPTSGPRYPPLIGSSGACEANRRNAVSTISPSTPADLTPQGAGTNRPRSTPSTTTKPRPERPGGGSRSPSSSRIARRQLVNRGITSERQQLGLVLGSRIPAQHPHLIQGHRPRPGRPARITGRSTNARAIRTQLRAVLASNPKSNCNHDAISATEFATRASGVSNSTMRSNKTAHRPVHPGMGSRQPTTIRPDQLTLSRSPNSMPTTYQPPVTQTPQQRPTHKETQKKTTFRPVPVTSPSRPRDPEQTRPSTPRCARSARTTRARRRWHSHRTGRLILLLDEVREGGHGNQL